MLGPKTDLSAAKCCILNLHDVSSFLVQSKCEGQGSLIMAGKRLGNLLMH